MGCQRMLFNRQTKEYYREKWDHRFSWKYAETTKPWIISMVIGTIFSRGWPRGNFSKILLGVGRKWLNFFFPTWNYENNLYCWNFQNPGGVHVPPAPLSPSDTHDHKLDALGKAEELLLFFKVFHEISRFSSLWSMITIE